MNSYCARGTNYAVEAWKAGRHFAYGVTVLLIALTVIPLCVIVLLEMALVNWLLVKKEQI